MRAAFTLLVMFAIFALPVASLATDNEAEARKLEELFMAPCCGGTTLALHDSSAAHRMKLEIRQMLDAGKTRQEIIDHYVAQHGHTILSMPETHGFGLVAYVVPFLALILLPLLMWGIIRRWTRNNAPSPEPEPGPVQPIDPAFRERLEKELRGY